MRTLPLDYKAYDRAWMTSDPFCQWVHKLDRKFATAGRKVLLLVDQCSSHVEVSDLATICLAYLSTNTSFILQPMDQGVKRSLKVLYRHLVERMILCMDTCTGSEYQVNLLSTLHMLARAWVQVTTATIAN